MHIRTLDLTNIRGFERLQADFGNGRDDLSGFSVIAGANGTGKTTILQAIAAACLGPSNLMWLLERPERWVRLASSDGDAKVVLIGQDEDRRAPGDIEGSFTLGARWSRTGASTRLFPRGSHNFISTQFDEAAALGATPRGWLLAGYGANRTASRSSPDAETMAAGPPRRAALTTLFRADAGLSQANAWVAELVGIAYTQGHEAAAVRRAKTLLGVLEPLVASALSKELFPEAPEALSLTMNSYGVGLQRDGLPTLALEQLGMGRQTVAFLVIDLLRQFDGFFGQEQVLNHWDAQTSSLNLPGLVLIDEAENHLHPAPQQRLGAWFTRHFPRVQVIATTHSPWLCQSASPRALFHLDGEGRLAAVSDATERRVRMGSGDEAVVSEMFGLQRPWSPVSEQHRDRAGALRARWRRTGMLTPDERQELDALSGELPSLLDDPKLGHP